MRIYKIIMIILFSSILFLGGYLTLTRPDKLISETENRILKQAPKYSKEKLMDGSLFSEFDEYFKDQIVGRKRIILLSSKIDMAMKKTKYNDVVIGKDGYLLKFNSFYPEKTSKDIEKDTSYISKEIKDLNNHINKNKGKFLFVGIPTQSYFNSDKYIYPFNNGYQEQLHVDNSLFGKLQNYNINYIDMKNTFKNSKEQLHYKTDHHYNHKGAYLTYVDIINNLRKNGVKIKEPFTLDELKMKTIDKPFRGSWNSNLNWIYKNDDRAVISTMKMPPYDNIVNYEKRDKIYYDKYKNYISYWVYMDGDKAEQVIKTNRKDLPKALIFGDSYTNAVEPLLFMHFNETRILDLRHYFDMNLYDYIEKYKPDVVIYVTSNTSYTIKDKNNDFKGKFRELKK